MHSFTSRAVWQETICELGFLLHRFFLKPASMGLLLPGKAASFCHYKAPALTGKRSFKESVCPCLDLQASTYSPPPSEEMGSYNYD